MYRKAPSDFWRFYDSRRDLFRAAKWRLNHPRVAIARFRGEHDSGEARKTGEKTVSVPIASQFRVLLVDLHQQAGKPNNGPVWPAQAQSYIENGAGAFSNEFYDQILAPCGLVQARANKKGSAKAASRSACSIQFRTIHSGHSFVHAFVGLGR
jgi:hypothetical protein